MLKNFKRYIDFKSHLDRRISLLSSTTIKKISIKEIKVKLEKEGNVIIYESKCKFTYEKLLIDLARYFILIFSSVIILTNVRKWIKILNLFFLAPFLIIHIDTHYSKISTFVKTIKLLPGNKLLIENMWNENQILNIEDIKKADYPIPYPKLISKIAHEHNHEFYHFLFNKKTNIVYLVPIDGIYLNEELFRNISEGKLI